ncbi:hypothetical protein [Streptomyces sp. NRRL S-920]|uniref:hypothetical protein n=1 Tax=Streptomyces sp. NRRL S-920 TaxID=1463921 RepID=UPI0004C7BFB3|nr:hypothetical protein [Streptomyces sp. NRRL S-920]
MNPTHPATPYGPHLPEAAAYLPADDEKGYRDVVLPTGTPHADGTITALSARLGKHIRIAIKDLHPLPELPPLEGEPTTWWRVTNKAGQTITQVQADDYAEAKHAAEQVPAARRIARREGGLSYRRLRSTELSDSDL